MFSDPFAVGACAETVGVFEALLRDLPEQTCVELTLTPVTAVVGVILFGLVIMALQAVVRRLWHGPRTDRPVAGHEPELSLREAANQARAERLRREERRT